MVSVRKCPKVNPKLTQSKSTYIQLNMRKMHPKPHAHPLSNTNNHDAVPRYTSLEQRAHRIQIGSKLGGRTRVPRNIPQSAEPSEPDLELRTAPAAEPAFEPQIYHPAKDVHRTEIEEPDAKEEKWTNDRQEYKFKAPQAARYFLWDSTRTSKTTLLTPLQLLGCKVRVSKQCLKALAMHFLKLDLLATAGTKSGIEQGFMLAKMDIQDGERVLCIDCFDAGKVERGGRVPSVMCKDDVVVQVNAINTGS
jgi:hypothetical protein